MFKYLFFILFRYVLCHYLISGMYINLNIILVINYNWMVVMDDNTLKTFAYISISSYRIKAIKAMQNGNETPTQIANDSDIRLSHISKVLKELKDCAVAECINEQERKNRIYRLTPLGHEIAENLD